MSARLASIADYQEIVEEFLPLISEQMSLRFSARLKGDEGKLTIDSLEEEVTTCKWLSDELIPGYLGGSVVIAVWAAFEQCINDLMEYLRNKEGIPLRLGDLREQNIRKKTEKYIHTATKNKFCFPFDLYDIQFIRNAFAHHSGDISAMSDKQIASIKELERSKNGILLIEERQLVVQHCYVRDCLSRVDACLSALLEFLEGRYPRAHAAKSKI